MGLVSLIVLCSLKVFLLKITIVINYMYPF
jgi:hypothetical protein